MARTPLGDLIRMTSVMRPHQSIVEQRFIKDWLWPLELKVDSCGNLYKWIGQDPTICWACHVDTVHRQGGTQFVTLEDGFIKLAKSSAANCLGGDDTCGVWLMREMVMARKPGLYIFHRGEEKGCIGSGFISKNNKKALEGIKAVISLDRRGTKSVITYQRGWRCCSDEFGKSLAAALGMEHETDPTGLYTDSANYTDLVGECTNISVGFSGEHSSGESIDSRYLLTLRSKLIDMDTSKLVFKRKAGEKDSRYNYNSTWGDEFGGGFVHSSYYGGRYNSHRKSAVTDYKKEFKHGYWDEDAKKWIALTLEEWELWRVGKGAKYVTLNAHEPNPASLWTPMEAMIMENISLFSRMLIDSWGFDLPMLQDLLNHHRAAEEEAKAKEKAEAFASKDEKRLALPPPKTETGHESKADEV